MHWKPTLSAWTFNWSLNNNGFLPYCWFCIFVLSVESSFLLWSHAGSEGVLPVIYKSAHVYILQHVQLLSALETYDPYPCCFPHCLVAFLLSKSFMHVFCCSCLSRAGRSRWASPFLVSRAVSLCVDVLIETCPQSDSAAWLMTHKWLIYDLCSSPTLLLQSHSPIYFHLRTAICTGESEHFIWHWKLDFFCCCCSVLTCWVCISLFNWLYCGSPLPPIDCVFVCLSAPLRPSR